MDPRSPVRDNDVCPPFRTRRASRLAIAEARHEGARRKRSLGRLLVIFAVAFGFALLSLLAVLIVAVIVEVWPW